MVAPGRAHPPIGTPLAHPVHYCVGRLTEGVTRLARACPALTTYNMILITTNHVGTDALGCPVERSSTVLLIAGK